MALDSGTRLGRYEIVGRLGAGGMGEVYRARDEYHRAHPQFNEVLGKVWE